VDAVLALPVDAHPQPLLDEDRLRDEAFPEALDAALEAEDFVRDALP
jgi:hypothetical protein